MDNSFQTNIKEILTSISNDDLSTLKSKYNNIYGEDGYDRLISDINNIENNYMVEGSYDKEKMFEVNSKIANFYENYINDQIISNSLDLRNKESLIESFQVKLNELINSYDERIELNEIQNKRKY